MPPVTWRGSASPSATWISRLRIYPAASAKRWRSRALRLNAELIVMDEPTAALGVKETAQVLDLIRRLKADGKTIILVSHNMTDVVAVATRVAIFKNGRKVIDRPVAGLDAD